MKVEQPTILLFDVDGTLITSGGLGRRAIESTLEARYDGQNGCSFSFAGMTDRGIVRAALQTLGREVTEEHIDDVLDDYIATLRQQVAQLDPASYFAHPGVAEVLTAVSDVDGVAVGLGTGNVEQGARIKLEPVGLNHYFRFGGYGCDAEPRAELIAAGARRGAAELGVPTERCRVVIIGDTLRDVAAAHAIGGECLAVATGGDTAQALAESDAELVVADLTAAAVVPFLLGHMY